MYQYGILCAQRISVLLLKYKAIILVLGLIIFYVSLVSLQPVFTRILFEFEGPFTWDTPLYWAVGKQWIQGVPMYEGMFEFKPPLIFIMTGLSYFFTGDYYALNYFTGITYILTLLSPFVWLLPSLRKQYHPLKLFLTVIIAIFFMLYGYMNSAYVQVEWYGAFFMYLYILQLLTRGDHQFNLKQQMLAGLLMMLAVLIKEPFVLITLAVSLLMIKSAKLWFSNYLMPLVIGGVLGILLLLVTGTLLNYFTVYLPYMLSSHIQRFGSPFERALNVPRLINDLNFHLPGFANPLMYLALFLVMIKTVNLRIQYNLRHAVQFAGLKFILLYTALYLSSFAVGMGGYYYNHHFVFALPSYAALLFSLLTVMDLPLENALKKLTILATTLTVTFATLQIYNLEPFERETWLLNLQTEIREQAMYVDKVMDYVEQDTYQFIGFNGPVYYGHTASLPKGPVFFQDPYNFTTLDSWFLQTFMTQLEEVNVIIVRHIHLGVIQDEFVTMLQQAFTTSYDAGYVSLRNQDKPTHFNDVFYFRKTFLEV